MAKKTKSKAEELVPWPKKAAKKLKVKKPELLPSTKEEIEEELKIESGVMLGGISLNGQIWKGSLTIKTTLPKAYHQYKMRIELDERPHLRRIDDLNRDFSNSLFRTDKATRKQNDQNIGEIRKKLETLRKECEVIEFSVTLEGVKWPNGMTTINVRLPDDVIEPFNRQKSRMDLYKVTLFPIL